MEQWMTFVQEISFPIIVSFYLLHRIEAKLVAIHEALLISQSDSRDVT